MERLRHWAGLLLGPPGPIPRPTWRGYAFDAALALVVCVGTVDYALDRADDLVPSVVGGLPVMATPTPEVVAFGVFLAVAASVPLALRRRYPLAVLWVVLAATLLTPPEGARLTFYACVIAAYSAAAYSPHRGWALASVVGAVAAVGLAGNTTLPTVPTKYVTMLVLVPIVVAANGLRTWKLRTDESLRQLTALEREQAEAVRRAAERERARIARELHDVVTHNVSVMVIQAGAARKVMDTAPEQAREALLAVEAGGRAAMAELRHVMGLLAPDTAAELAPQPDLDQLDALVGRVRDTGVPVELTVRGRRRPVPSGVGLAAYRVVQEALTNAVKHAAGASTEVTVDYGADRLRVEVTDTGGEPDGSTSGNGLGLLGLRERLAVYGGTLRAGPRPAGGYRVTALIPLEAP
ncbi:sensor histidine kinase [Saccharothrix coeruleofusca]|uniref:histidine kinase n=1 Tax=Saccharothrix coeruleofusca TaxID=33919 RepID=A0A918EF49_9PSEU|nr:histidine kinase [Saccharothrix coeruleofusca]GGP61605.1 two-component sensor histidine kinase [Saccharothrix coeruleofusca]